MEILALLGSLKGACSLCKIKERIKRIKRQNQSEEQRGGRSGRKTFWQKEAVLRVEPQ